MGCYTFEEMLGAAQNHWSADHTEADTPLHTITLLQNSTVPKISEEANPMISLPTETISKTQLKTQDESNITNLIECFEKLALNRLVPRPPIACNNCGQYGHYI